MGCAGHTRVSAAHVDDAAIRSCADLVDQLKRHCWPLLIPAHFLWALRSIHRFPVCLRIHGSIPRISCSAFGHAHGVVADASGHGEERVSHVPHCAHLLAGGIQSAGSVRQGTFLTARITALRALNGQPPPCRRVQFGRK